MKDVLSEANRYGHLLKVLKNPTDVYEADSIIAALVRPLISQLEVPHFPLFFGPSKEEEAGRCAVLREFLNRRCHAFLYGPCARFNHGNKFPACLVISVTLDILRHINCDQRESLMLESFDGALGAMAARRFKNLAAWIKGEKNTRLPVWVGNLWKTLQEYCEYRRNDEDLIDLAELKNGVIEEELCRLEFKHWLKGRTKIIEGELKDTELVRSPCFRDGTLVSRNLPRELSKKCRKRNPSKLDEKRNECREEFTLRFLKWRKKEWLAKGKSRSRGQKEFLRQHYDDIIKKYFPKSDRRIKALQTSRETIQRSWLGHKPIKAFLKAKGEWDLYRLDIEG